MTVDITKIQLCRTVADPHQTVPAEAVLHLSLASAYVTRYILSYLYKCSKSCQCNVEVSYITDRTC